MFGEAKLLLSITTANFLLDASIGMILRFHNMGPRIAKKLLKY
jgi:hypothetical protein